MEGTMAEIRIFAGNFAPRTWAFCQGQTLPISQNQALFALLGTIYGGNGSTTFQLPNLSGRVPVGTGAGTAGAPNVQTGQIAGEETHTITLDELPKHTHTAVISGTLSAPAPPVTFYGGSSAADSSDAVGNLFGDTSGAGLSIYASGTSDTVAMAFNEIAVSVNLSGSPSMTLQSFGSNAPHSNIQPYIAMNYVVCLRGIFPSRN
jgi:microcystin-dependent protein